MGLQLLFVQNPLHGGFRGTSQARMAGGLRLPTHMSGQGFPCPQFRGITKFFGFRTSQMHHPSFIGAANDRFFRPMKDVVKTGFHTHLQSFMQTMVDGHPTHVQDSLNPEGLCPL